MDKSREQFEKWMSDNGKYPLAIEKMDKNYILATTRTQWEAWQASRAAVEIELPPKFGEHQQQLEGNGWNWMRSHSVNAIRAAGLKVKGE
ncbi:hypothetical protein ACYAO4_002727 [Cronobacter turicensis]|uniref:hypothetical protein n=1 Tax=Cronobacter turicensis TaxID=413502 RepID=UPI0024C26F05|nr:hypothetical protein [Cronobacter turicensis]MDK1334212.1 hypothetical protein [Cronobacter turicensis]